MTTITNMLGFTSYNPTRELIYAAALLVGPFLIDKLSLKPTNVVSQIDRIRENIFGAKTQFLTFTQTNALTKHTWIFLKNFPTCLALSSLCLLIICSNPETVVDPYMFHSAKYALATLFSLITLAPDDDAKVKKDSRPKNFPARNSMDAYLLFTQQRDAETREYAKMRGYKDFRPCVNPGGSYAFVGAFKDISRPCVTRSQSLPTSPVGAKQLC